MRKEQVELRKKRKLSEDENFELSSKALKLWNELRDSRTEKLRKEQLIDQLLDMLKDNLRSFVRKHDTARVLQTVIKHGTAAQRTKVFEELKEDIVELSKMKFARFFVTKMCKYGNVDQRRHIIKSMYGNVKVLLRHACASSVLETVYNETATAQQRAELVQEYYGPEFALFKNDKTVHLRDAIDKMDPTKAKKVMSHLKNELNELCNKMAVKMSITHFLLREFYKNADPADKNEISQSWADKVVEILHTKDGSRAAMQCIWNCSAKERKIIMKSFKKLVPSIAKEEHGHYVLLALFDSVDDTKLLEKCIIEELFDKQHLPEMLQNDYSSRVLMYLLCPRDPRYFHPSVQAILMEGDNNPFSKKDRNIRIKELQDAALVRFVEVAKSDVSLIFDNEHCILIYEILQKCDHDSYQEISQALASYILDKGELVDGDKQHPFFRGKQAFVIRKLLKFEKASQETEDKRSAFSVHLINEIKDSVVSSYLKSQKSCFILLLLLETNVPSVVKPLVNKLKCHADEFSNKKNIGAELLYKRFQAVEIL